MQKKAREKQQLHRNLRQTSVLRKQEGRELLKKKNHMKRMIIISHFHKEDIPPQKNTSMISTKQKTHQKIQSLTHKCGQILQRLL
jgi:hypothetical protein